MSFIDKMVADKKAQDAEKEIVLERRGLVVPVTRILQTGVFAGSQLLCFDAKPSSMIKKIMVEKSFRYRGRRTLPYRPGYSWEWILHRTNNDFEDTKQALHCQEVIAAYVESRKSAIEGAGQSLHSEGMEEVSEPIADFKVSVGASECGYKPAAVTDDRCCYLEKGHRGIHPLRAPKEKNYNSVLSKETLIFQREELTEKNERLRKCNDKIYQELAELRNVHQRNGVLQADNLALLARIEHLEGHIEVLKLEAAPSAAAAAKPKSTIKIYCQNDEDI